jgi:4-hydroxybenzoyl-CoA reductase subunit beta
MSLPEFKLLRPASLGETIEMLSRYGDRVKVVAGGTDVLPSMKQKLFTPEYVLDLRGVGELRGIATDVDGGLSIGALTTLSAIEHSRIIQRDYPVLFQAVRTVASPVLRNMGTLGGNICLDTRCLWYNQSLLWRKSCGFCLKKDGDLCHVAPGGKMCWAAFSGDTAPALLCLGAELEITGRAGSRLVRLSEFYVNDGIVRLHLSPSEIITRILLPRPSSGWKGSYQKLRVRGSIDYPLAGVAVALKMQDGRVTQARMAITAVNPAPHLVVDVEALLPGMKVDDHVATTVGELAAKVAKPLTTSALTPEYRREMVKVFAKRALLEAASN